MPDGDLRQKFSTHLPDAFWQGVESWSTGQGVPDAHYVFPGGLSGWIENKLTSSWQVSFEPQQGAWLERYARQGGRAFVAVRRLTTAGPIKGPAVDELWLFKASQARVLQTEGLQVARELGRWPGGAAKWDWGQIRTLLTK